MFTTSLSSRLPLRTLVRLAPFMALAAAGSARAAEPVQLDYYLPPGVSYDERIPQPSDVLEFEVGEWHVRHDQLVHYMEALAEASDRVQLEVTARTWEHRPVLLLTISSPQNLRRIEQLRQEHLDAIADNAPVQPTDPAVVWLCYSVHGNESSGSNAALLAAYYLAAARGPEIEELLQNNVILIDPALNPDGLDRFAGWANRNRGMVPVADPNAREHDEPWPSGRTNHYWFDLNRDWLLLTNPESEGRLATFHRWMPNLLCDFHEMGSQSTFFFQPGVPSRQNPLTPQENLDLTRRITQFHANAFDTDGRLYYSEEDFDDYYYGKGSTYPDLNGGVGILFEQASARGQVQETQNGPLTFPFTIKGQFLATLASLRAVQNLGGELLQYQHKFYHDAQTEAAADPVKAWVFGDPADRGRTYQMVRILRGHDITVHRIQGSVERDGIRFSERTAFVVPTNQPQYRLIKTLFETRTEFPDSLFYDVSTWTLPLACGVPYASLPALDASLLGEAVAEPAYPTGREPEVSGLPYAYAFTWNEYAAPRSLYRLEKENVRVRVATLPFKAPTSRGQVGFPQGTILVTAGGQTVDPRRIRELLVTAAHDDGVTVYTLPTGLTPEGIDLGSPSIRVLERPKPVLVSGEGTDSNEVGEAWHLLDAEMGMEVSLVDRDALPSVDLSRYTHVLLVDGTYDTWDSTFVETLRGWVSHGGVLVASQRATKWAVDHKLAPDKIRTKEKPSDEKDEPAIVRRPYADADRDRGAKVAAGAILATNLDLTHPLAFGYERDQLPFFRTSNLFLEPSENPYATMAAYADQPLLSGYIHPENLELAGGSAAVIAERVGAGMVILIADDLNFRGVWYGTSHLYLNTLFFGRIIDRTGGE